ncbi:amidohydrolase family protein [Megalodesulfovibrio gigas]|uniref:Putative amidohydrolase n=1 Tax=Megalodesulfovibrio gigas (strain ATCC 19364 / DSM 1382 / NCIMB 9332 / VKM B-1759) TaxID=1121448 RepID=T2GCT0_MEGG1|nr:amidohydrolase family protein [Megalodesulfovibrio gigas]AGW13712.1 putative amidohydrolase [Megalodesulfovibrio gigas DSM 1382 = ATCC 19364]
MRTDFHTHAFHPKIASKVCEQLHQHYGAKPSGDGTVDDLLARAEAAGIEQVVALCAATVPAQVQPANDFAMHLQNTYPQITAFGTLHPHGAGWEEELDRLRAAGIKGLKFHPEFQGFWMDDPMLLPLLEASQDFIWMFHVGDAAPPEQNPSCPIKLGKILDRFPDARVVAAHLGGYRHWDWAVEHLAGRDVWFDTSSSMPFIRQETLERILRKHDPDRILFGSDYPLFDPVESMEALQARAGVDDATLERYWRNAETLLAE